jgi:hypothetical protein
MVSCCGRTGCTDSTGNRTDGTRRAGIIRRPVPRTVSTTEVLEPHEVRPVPAGEPGPDLAGRLGDQGSATRLGDDGQMPGRIGRSGPDPKVRDAFPARRARRERQDGSLAASSASGGRSRAEAGGRACITLAFPGAAGRRERAHLACVYRHRVRSWQNGSRSLRPGICPADRGQLVRRRRAARQLAPAGRTGDRRRGGRVRRDHRRRGRRARPAGRGRRPRAGRQPPGTCPARCALAAGGSGQMPAGRSRAADNARPGPGGRSLRSPVRS